MDTKILCLGVLADGEASGYEIKKQMEEGPLAHFYRAGFGSIYPALNKLDKEGLVTCTEMAQEKRPGKKIYRITERGKEAFREALCTRPCSDWVRSDYLFMMFFADFLDSGRLEEVYEGYLHEYRNAIRGLQDMELCQSYPGRRFVHAFGLHLYKAMVEFMENNRDLLTEERTEDDGRAEGDRVGAAE